MPIDPDASGSTGAPTEFSWTAKDSLLYALGVGAGVANPTGFELEFTTENSSGVQQVALPTQGVVISSGQIPNFGDFNPAFLLHAEQRITLHQQLPTEGTAIATVHVAEIYDKIKAALVYLETDVTDTEGNPMWSSRAGLFISGEGGWGGNRGPSKNWELPSRKPDKVVTYPTRTDQALLYRLSGDRNPLHSDPIFAKSAGFETPILHGLCTYGFTGRALLHAVCDSDPARFQEMGGRFKSPVTPGETLEVHLWEESDTVLFQTHASNGRVVFDEGLLKRL